MTQPIGSLLLLGASGDLSGRLLLPAFGQLLDHEPERRSVVLIGAGSEDWDDAAWKDRVTTSFGSAEVSQDSLNAVLEKTRYHRTDVTSAADLEKLIAAAPPAPALYFALPPPVTAKACAELQRLSLPEGTTLVLEKPFGTDQASAAELNKLLTRIVPEEQIHRVDHFLGRSSVLNLLGFRFGNRLFEPLWDAQHVERVDIIFDEKLALENRARYYDGAGALVDMIQSHLLQVLALVAMEPLTEVTAVDLQSAKSKVLRACRPWPDPIAAGRRARYTGGDIDGRQIPDYAAEQGVDPSRNTETLAELVVEIDNWRWSGVPFRMRSGKALADLHKEVIVTFKPIPHLPTGLRGVAAPDRLHLLMGPDGMALDINVNGPADPLVLDRVSLTTEFSPGRLPAYGEVLSGVLGTDPLLSVRGDTAEECWRIVDPVLQAWREGKTPLDTYPAGSNGPSRWPDPTET